MSVLIILAIATAVFLGTLTRTLFGFGEAIVSMPLLALLPLHWPTAVALMGLVSLTVAAVTVTTGWRHIHQRELVPVILAALPGIPVGLWMVATVPSAVVTGLLGVALIVYGAFSWSRTRFIGGSATPKPVHARWGLVFGIASGVFGSAYNFTGIPVAIYGSLRGWDPRTFRSTLQAYFLGAGLLIAAGQGLSGLWTLAMGRLYLFSIPAVAAGVTLGTALQKRIPAAKFHRYVFVAVTALGAILVLRLLL